MTSILQAAEAIAQEKKLLQEANAAAKEKKKAAPKPKAKPLRPENSLFYKLYPQDDTAGDAAERYRKAFLDDEGGEPGVQASDEAMKGAFAALKFVSGGSSGSSSGAQGSGGQPASAAPAGAAAAAGSAQEADSLKRKLLEALSGDGLDSAAATAASAASAAPAGSGAFREGGIVEIHGLKGAPELNGRVGKLERLDPASGRWQVDVDGAGPKKLKPDNLRWPAEAAASSASSAAEPAVEDPSKKARTTTFV